jgi:hypothetical protein
MYLPKIEVIRLQSRQRFFQHPHCQLLGAAVGAEFSHQKCLVALSFQRVAQPLLAATIVIFPGIVEEIDAGIDGSVDNSSGFILRVGGTEMKAADSDDGDGNSGFAEQSAGNLLTAVPLPCQN